MKLIFLLLVLMVVLSGCVGYKYVHIKYASDGKLVQDYYYVEANKAMVNDTKHSISMKLPDKATLTVGDVNTTDSPESAEAIGNAIEKGIKAYNGTSAVETIIDSNN